MRTQPDNSKRLFVSLSPIKSREAERLQIAKDVEAFMTKQAKKSKQVEHLIPSKKLN